MEQKTLIKTEIDEFTTQLFNALVKRSLIEKFILEELIENKNIAVDKARKEINGTCYLIDYESHTLKIFDTYSGEIKKLIPLPSKQHDFTPSDFDDWGTDAVIFNNEEIQKEGEIIYDKKYNYGLVVKDNKSFLYSPEIDKQKLLALTNYYISGAIPKKPKSGLPFDMYFSSDYSLLCLSNRDEGKIYLFDTYSYSFINEITVRNQGINKTINLAISLINQKIYITDNSTPIFNIYDMKTKTLSKKNLNIGILGNLCISPDEKSIYLIITKPEQNIKNLSLESLSEIKSFSPKGELFSIGDAPCDLINLSDDKRYVFSMTFINDPTPYTPVISVIDIEKNKLIKRFSIKDESKPINLCFQEINPVGHVNKTLEEMIIENKLFSINKLRDLKNAILNGEEDEFEFKENTEEFIEVKGEELEFELRNDKVENTGNYSGIKPRKLNRISIPKKANKHIKECLADSFWMKHEIDLRLIPEIQSNLDAIVEQVRKKLEDYDLEIIEIKGFYNKKQTLEGVILREFILEMIDEEESEDRKQIKTAPTNCPNCTAPLLGSWDCGTCGFEIEKPEDALRRKIASVDPLSNLNKGNVMLVDQANGELFEVDNFKVPVWKISKEQIGIESITSAIRLENMNTMILDGISGEIVEITPKGKIAKKLKIGGENLKLNNPTFFTLVNYDHLLIADTDSHVVMETDSEGNIIWEYGMRGISGITEPLLNRPTYIQKTYDGTYLITDSGNDRVIELVKYIDIETGQHQIKIQWEYGSKLTVIDGKASQLKSPIMAQKDLSGNVTILDAGNRRIIEVDRKDETIATGNKINWQYNTKTREKETSIIRPEKFTRLKNKDILVSGDGKFVQFMPSANNRIVWFSTRKELALKNGLGVIQESVTKIKVKYGAVPQIRLRLPKYEIRSPEELEKELELIVIQKMREATIAPPLWVDSEKPLAFFTQGKIVRPMPVLIIDRVNNKIMISDRKANVFWSYGDNKVEKLVRVKTAHITPEKTVLITNAKQLMEVKHDKLKDYYFQAEHELKLNKDETLISDVSERIWEYPCKAESATRLLNGNTLICETKKLRVIEMTKDEKIVWEHQHSPRVALASYATRLINGNTLITYSSAHVVVEVTPNHKIVWRFGEDRIAADDNKHLSFPEYAYRLDNGNTLIADTKNGRIVEVDYKGEAVWIYKGTDIIRLISPNYVQRLIDGNTYIVHGGNRELLEVDKKGEIAWKLTLPLQK